MIHRVGWSAYWIQQSVHPSWCTYLQVQLQKKQQLQKRVQTIKSGCVYLLKSIILNLGSMQEAGVLYLWLILIVYYKNLQRFCKQRGGTNKFDLYISKLCWYYYKTCFCFKKKVFRILIQIILQSLSIQQIRYKLLGALLKIASYPGDEFRTRIVSLRL